MTSSKIATQAAPLIDGLLAGVRDALGENLTGVYLSGSLALGGFDPETSDVDVIVVTGRPVSDAEFAVLKALHERLPGGGERLLARLRRLLVGVRNV